MRLRKIICPIDASVGSSAALQVAARLARDHDCELVLVNAWYLPPAMLAGDFTYPSTLIRELDSEATTGLASAVSEARALGATRCSSLVLEGQPWQMIVEAAEQHPTSDLIVMGTHGRTGLARVLLGSVAEMVIRHAPCSVLAIPPGRTDTRSEHALCPIEFSISSRRALALAATIVTGAHPTLTLLHVIEPPRSYSEEPRVFELEHAMRREAERVLEQWARSLEVPATVTTRLVVRVGRPGDEINAELEAGPCELVAMGSHGRTGLRRLVLGSVAEHTMRTAGRAVLVARESIP
ncbi:universal stress protein [soil metagenome]